MQTNRLNLRRGLLLVLVVSMMSWHARAQSMAPEALRYEISTLAGYRFGGNLKRIDTGQSVRIDDHASMALAFDFLANDATQYELFYGRQDSQLTGSGAPPAKLQVEYLHLGGLVPFEATPRLNPYFGGGLGITRLSPDPALGVDNTRLSLSLALGVRVPLNHRLSLRFEGRGFLTPISKDSAFFCRSDQNGALCKIRVRGDVLFQADFLAGAAFAF